MIYDIEVYLKDEDEPVVLPVEARCHTELANLAAQQAEQLGSRFYNFGPHLSAEDRVEIAGGLKKR